MEQSAPVRILGIDPGTNVLGFAIIDADKRTIRVLEMGVVTFTHISDEATEKLRYIFEQVQDIILQHKPGQMAIEAPFFRQKRAVNAQTWKSAGCCHCSRHG